jgi:hypothetical protein
MLEKLKNFDVDRLDLDELVMLSAFARILVAEFEVLKAQTPEWLEIQTKVLRRAILARQADMLEKRLREAKLRRDALKTPDEKRAALDNEIAELTAALGR